MQKKLKQFLAESGALKAVIVFVVSFIILSFVWLQVKDIYGYGITLVASKFIAEVKDARLEGLSKGTDVIYAYFSSVKGGKYISLTIPVSVSSYSSNVPLTVSLLITLFPYIKRRKRAYAEAGLFLLLFHILYVFFLGTTELTKTFTVKGLESVGLIQASFYHFFEGFTKYGSMSFAPFLIVIYIFIRFRK